MGYRNTSNFVKYSAARRIVNSSRCLDIPMKQPLSCLMYYIKNSIVLSNFQVSQSLLKNTPLRDNPTYVELCSKGLEM